MENERGRGRKERREGGREEGRMREWGSEGGTREEEE